MKNLVFAIVASMLLLSVSCSKSTTDPPAPVNNYTIKYSAESTGNVLLDTIMYLDENGSEQYKYNLQKFDLSFEQPSNNYHGKILIKGKIINGSCNYGLYIMDKDGGIVQVKSDGTSSSITSYFQFSAEFSESSN